MTPRTVFNAGWLMLFTEPTVLVAVVCAALVTCPASCEFCIDCCPVDFAAFAAISARCFTLFARVVVRRWVCETAV